MNGDGVGRIAAWAKCMSLLGMGWLIALPSVPLWPLGQTPSLWTVEKAAVILGAASGLFILVARKDPWSVPTYCVAAAYVMVFKSTALQGAFQSPWVGFNGSLSDQQMEWAFIGWGSVFWCLAALFYLVEVIARGRGAAGMPRAKVFIASLGLLVLFQLFSRAAIGPWTRSEISVNLALLRRLIEGIVILLAVSSSTPILRGALGLGVAGAGLVRIAWIMITGVG